MARGGGNIVDARSNQRPDRTPGPLEAVMQQAPALLQAYAQMQLAQQAKQANAITMQKSQNDIAASDAAGGNALQTLIAAQQAQTPFTAAEQPQVNAVMAGIGNANVRSGAVLEGAKQVQPMVTERVKFEEGKRNQTAAFDGAITELTKQLSETTDPQRREEFEHRLRTLRGGRAFTESGGGTMETFINSGLADPTTASMLQDQKTRIEIQEANDARTANLKASEFVRNTIPALAGIEYIPNAAELASSIFMYRDEISRRESADARTIARQEASSDRLRMRELTANLMLQAGQAAIGGRWEEVGGQVDPTTGTPLPGSGTRQWVRNDANQIMQSLGETLQVLGVGDQGVLDRQQLARTVELAEVKASVTAFMEDYVINEVERTMREGGEVTPQSIQRAAREFLAIGKHDPRMVALFTDDRTVAQAISQAQGVIAQSATTRQGGVINRLATWASEKLTPQDPAGTLIGPETAFSQPLKWLADYIMGETAAQTVPGARPINRPESFSPRTDVLPIQAARPGFQPTPQPDMSPGSGAGGSWPAPSTSTRR